jgi:hypothetical protein
MRENRCKLLSREHETLRFNSSGQKSILGESWKSPDLILKGYLLNNSLILCTILVYQSKYCRGRPLRFLQERTPNTPETFRGVSSNVFSSEVAWSHWRYKKYCSNPSHVLHTRIKFQCASLESFSRKLMLWQYFQTADCLSPANWRKVPKESILQVYNTAMHCYDISPNSWLT